MTRYATTTNLARLGIRAEALTGIATAVQEEALDASSAVADAMQEHIEILELCLARNAEAAAAALRTHLERALNRMIGI